jgi:nucleoside-diphosphate-sugar epimerase
VHATSSKQQVDGIHHGISWHNADLLDPNQLKDLVATVRPSHLLHLAWYSEHGKLYSSSESYSWVRASLDLLEQFVEQGGERVVMTGTCAEYDKDQRLCSEATSALAPDTTYGICKRALGDLLQAYAETSAVSGSWARLFFLYGPAEDPRRLVSSVVRALLMGQPARCSHGEQIRDYLYVEDAARALVQLLSSDLGGAVNVCSGEPIAVKEIVLEVAAQLGRERLVQFGAVQPRDGEPARIVGDTRRISRELGWRPHYKIDRGVEQTVSWWREKLSQTEAGVE